MQIPTTCWGWRCLEDSTTNGAVCSSSDALPTSEREPSVFSAKGRVYSVGGAPNEALEVVNPSLVHGDPVCKNLCELAEALASVPTRVGR